MNQQSTIIDKESASRRDPRSFAHTTDKDAGRHRVWGGLAMVLLVAYGAVFSFLPRPRADYPTTVVQPQQMLINSAVEVKGDLVAAGELGHLFYSPDKGNSWQSASVDVNRGSTLTRVFFPDDQLGIAIGHDRWILRSTDQGKSWQESSFGTERADVLFDVWGQPQHNFYAVGSFGAFWQSSDDGRTWNSRDIGLGDRHFYGLAGSDQQHLMLAGESGLVAVSGDGGDSWQQLPAFYNGSFFGVISLSADSWLVYGMRGKVYRTDDFGQTWRAVDSATNAALYGGVLTQDGKVVLVGEGGVVTVSADRGEHFEARRGGGGQSLSGAGYTADQRVLLVGQGGIATLPLAPNKPESSE